MKRRSPFLALAVLAAFGSHAPAGLVPAPQPVGTTRQRHSKHKITQAQIRRAARKRRNVRARLPMARKG